MGDWGYNDRDGHVDKWRPAASEVALPEDVTILAERAGTENREAVKLLLTAAHSDGRIDDAEFASRMAAADTAKTMKVLMYLTSDLPAPELPEETLPEKESRKQARKLDVRHLLLKMYVPMALSVAVAGGVPLWMASLRASAAPAWAPFIGIGGFAFGLAGALVTLFIGLETWDRIDKKLGTND